ncbi:VTC domain-containing protein [Cyathus striatus]|nr:VTC domain-containing protein [Cyathus striatus]
MKFGAKISNDLYNEWRHYYLDYNLLKRELKVRNPPSSFSLPPARTISSRGWTESDEQEFKKMLTNELDKIHEFQDSKTLELSRRIREAEKEVHHLVAEEHEDQHDQGNEDHNDTDPEQRRPAYTQDEGSDDDLRETDTDESFDALEERFHGLEEEVAILVADVHDLALYTKLNITGFMKILKVYYLEKRPFYKYNWDALIVKLSKLYDLVRTRGHPVQGDSSAGGSQSAFVRQTPTITSIYFDNEDLELYLGRLEKTEGAEAIRLRWYGDVNNKTIFRGLDRREIVKARFPLKEHLVNPFLRGEYTVDEDFQELVKKGKKTQQEVDTMIQLANEVQYSILTKKLQPVMRSFYNRTAFQLPGDAGVRISLDTELTLIREDNWDGKTRAGDNWRRTDFGIDYPFPQVADDDKELFKYGVLEVKLQTHFGQEPPKWVTDLVQSHLVEAVPKFSKFIHGCATLLPNRVDWCLDVDILKPDTGYLSVIERPSGSKSTSRQTPSTESRSPDLPQYTEPLSEGEDDEGDFGLARDEDKRLMLKERREEEQAKPRESPKTAAATAAGCYRSPFSKILKSRTLSIDPLAPSSAFDETLRDKLNKTKDAQERRARDSHEGVNNGREDDNQTDDEESQRANGDDRIIVRDWMAPAGKLISVPVRIEPKVYFAAERTFLKWMNNAVFIGSIATTLLNFLPADDTRGLISAAFFTFAALLAIAYSAGIFVYRSYRLRHRRAEGLYYDKYGPTVLCFVLFLALATNIGLRASQM